MDLTTKDLRYLLKYAEIRQLHSHEGSLEWIVEEEHSKIVRMLASCTHNTTVRSNAEILSAATLSQEPDDYDEFVDIVSTIDLDVSVIRSSFEQSGTYLPKIMLEYENIYVTDPGYSRRKVKEIASEESSAVIIPPLDTTLPFPTVEESVSVVQTVTGESGIVKRTFSKAHSLISGD